MASPPGTACLLEDGIISPLLSSRAWLVVWEPRAGPELWLSEGLLTVQTVPGPNAVLCLNWSRAEQPLGGGKT